MCAAPGSKTTQLAAMMQNTGVLIANDLQGSRLKALGINLRRCGTTNTMVTQMPGNYFKKHKERYDSILVDAPCSGTGTIRRSLKTLQMWSPNLVRKMRGIQKQLLLSAYEALKPGGLLIYSTCTLEPEEDEGMVGYLLDNCDLETEEIKLDIVRSNPITEWEGKEFNKGVEKCLRIYPQDNDTEGFFVAKMRKKK